MIISPAYASEAAHAAGHGSMLQDPTFWVAIAFFMTLFVLVKFAGKSISDALQARADSIAHKLNEASKLRADAQKLLEDYRQKQENSKAEIESALKQARDNAEHLKQNLQNDFELKLKDKEAAAEARLKRAADEASEEVRNMTVLLSTKTVEKILAEKLSGEAGKTFMQKAIDSLPQILSKKDL